MKRIMVLNMGMKSIRCIIFDSKGNKLASSNAPMQTYVNDEWVMQDPVEWWDKARLVIRESLRQIGGANIDYLTVTSSSSCLVALDAAGNSLEHCIMVSDRRAKVCVDELKSAHCFIDVSKKVGVDAEASLMVPKILWVKKYKPDVYGKTTKFIAPNDYLLFKFTGKVVTDSFNAQKLYFDDEQGKYPVNLFRELDIDLSLLPEVIPVGAYVSSILPHIAVDMGLNKDVQIRISSYDAICSFFGSGALNEGEASDVSGTVTVFRVLTYNKIERPKKVFAMPYNEWGIHIIGGSNNLGGGLIEWAKQCFYMNESYPYEIMEKEANEIEVGAHGLVFLPYLLGERAPIWNSNARGVFFGLERTHTRKDMTRAVFESTAFILRDFINAIEGSDLQVNSIRVSGGLARNNLISQIKADATGKEICVLDEFETTAAGAAMLVLLGSGEYKDLTEAASFFSTIRMIIKPNNRRKLIYDELYSFYKQLYNTSTELFTIRNEMVKRNYVHRDVIIQNL